MSSIDRCEAILNKTINTDTDAYKFALGAVMGQNRKSIEQAQRICSQFPNVENCVAQQNCSTFFPTCSESYSTCFAMTKCLQDTVKEPKWTDP